MPSSRSIGSDTPKATFRTSREGESQSSNASPRRTLQLQFKATDLERPALSNTGIISGLRRLGRAVNSKYKVSAFRPTSTHKTTSTAENSENSTQFEVVYESAIISNNRNPTWPKHSIDMEELLGGNSLVGYDILSPLLLSVFDTETVEGRIVETLIGQCETTAFDLNNFESSIGSGLNGFGAFSKDGFVLKNRSEKVVGSLIPLDASIYEHPLKPEPRLHPVDIEIQNIKEDTYNTEGGKGSDEDSNDDASTASNTTISTLVSETSKLKLDNAQLTVRVEDLEKSLRMSQLDQEAKAGMAIHLSKSMGKVLVEVERLKEEVKRLKKERRRSFNSSDESHSASRGSRSGHRRFGHHPDSRNKSRRSSQENSRAKQGLDAKPSAAEDPTTSKLKLLQLRCEREMLLQEAAEKEEAYSTSNSSRLQIQRNLHRDSASVKNNRRTGELEGRKKPSSRRKSMR